MACLVGAGCKGVIVSRPYSREFRDDVVRVAPNRDDGVTIDQIGVDFGVHLLTVTQWMPPGNPGAVGSWREVAQW